MEIIFYLMLYLFFSTFCKTFYYFYSTHIPVTNYYFAALFSIVETKMFSDFTMEISSCVVCNRKICKKSLKTSP